MAPIVLRISEMFGPTLQGEGQGQGRATLFLRLGLCNLDCSWCDTPYTWDWSGKNGIAFDKEKELRTVLISDVIEWVSELSRRHDVKRLVITGGEPLIQQKRLSTLVETLANEHAITVEIETNGTILPNDSIKSHCLLNVSPKLASSGVAPQDAIDIDTLAFIRDECQSTFKFVVKDETDLAEMRSLVDRLAIPPHRIFVMPEGRTREAILERLPALFEVCANNGWNLSPRLHVLAFNDKRGI